MSKVNQPAEAWGGGVRGAARVGRANTAAPIKVTRTGKMVRKVAGSVAASAAQPARLGSTKSKTVDDKAMGTVSEKKK